jgi:3',5'-cyclic AMP phosphodiesterase CpdA
MRIAQVADFHFTKLTWNPFRLLSKRLLGNINWLFKRKKSFSTKQLEPLPDLFKELGVDLVLLGGDFTTTALREEFETSAQFIKKIKQPWLAIPGNHDHYTWLSYWGKHFYRYYTNKRKAISHKAEFFNLKEHGIEGHDIGSNWWVIALDTARAINSLIGALHSGVDFFQNPIKTHIKPF